MVNKLYYVFNLCAKYSEKKVLKAPPREACKHVNYENESKSL